MKKYRLLFAGIAVLIVILAVGFTSGNPTRSQGMLMLEPPTFVQAASQDASGMSPEVIAMISDEAGISAYIETAGSIDLSQVEGEFRTIEAQTADYIIGSVPVPNYVEHFDVHVYVHSDGWILAYYMEDEVTSKMVDVKSVSINSTILETTVATIAGAAGQAVSDLKYYDFRYPNATNILMVAEDSIDGRYFTIQLPSGYAYYERSWAEKDSNEFLVDGAQVNVNWYSSGTAYGSISTAQLLPDVSHTVNIDDWSGYNGYYGVLVITYRVP